MYIEGDKSEKRHGSQFDSLKGELKIIVISDLPVVALASMQQTAFSSQKPLCHFVFLCTPSQLFFKGVVEDFIFMYHFFIAKMSLFVISGESMADMQHMGGGFLSLFEAI